MTKSRLSLYCFLLPVLFSGLSWGLWAQDSFTPPAELPAQNSDDALTRLTAISVQLSDLNEKLQTELQDSRRNSRALQNMLESSKKEAEHLRQELAALKTEAETFQRNSTGLLNAAENSQTELTALQEALRKAESSLMSLELSFAAYRETAEGRIKTLEKRNRVWKWGCIAAGVLAVGLGTALIAGR